MNTNNQSSLFIRFLILCNLLSLGFIMYLFLSGFMSGENNHFAEISAEQINIVNSDGIRVMAISGKGRIAKSVLDGKTYPLEVTEGRKNAAGIIFFNETGDEMGGLIYNSYRRTDGKAVGLAHFSFDRFKDNQVLALQHNENIHGTVRSGLTIYDRTGSGSFKKSLDLLEESLLKTTTPERTAEINAALKEMHEKKELGAERLFIGSRNEEAQIQLKDKKGKIRSKFYVDNTTGEAKLEFLNENGNVIAVFPK